MLVMFMRLRPPALDHRATFSMPPGRRSAPGLSSILPERSLAHLVAHRHDRWVRQRTPLPVRAVDDQRVTGDEARVRRREKRRGPLELLPLPDTQRGLTWVLVARALQ